MIFVIITTCIFNNCNIRKNQYIQGINSIKSVFANNNINCKMIIVENNGKRDTFLDYLGLPVLYTNNNKLNTSDKGYKELQDIFDCINEFKIDNENFIVKFTGRYLLHSSSVFIKILKEYNNNDNDNDNKYDCLIRYGAYFNEAPKYKVEDCVSGLIGMKCKYMRLVKQPEEHKECVEHNWAKATNLINNEKICILRSLGIDAFPVANGGNQKISL